MYNLQPHSPELNKWKKIGWYIYCDAEQLYNIPEINTGAAPEWKMVNNWLSSAIIMTYRKMETFIFHFTAQGSALNKRNVK